MAIERRRISVSGVVQGIGFRPFVRHLADELGLTGTVQNNGGAVTIELQGRVDRLDLFERRLLSDLPPGGRIERSDTSKVAPLVADAGFRILASAETDGMLVSLAPDRAVCPDCLAEMRDPADRRYGYPFTNCTACGPRYTITAGLPYDRPNTTMVDFKMCPDCLGEYTDPNDRRYHAQPIACPACGPALRFVSAAPVDDQKAALFAGDSNSCLRETAKRLGQGGIVAIKGIGGFHLAVDARNEAAVMRLRRRKNRPGKPLALMARNLEVAGQIVTLDQDAEALLASPAAPIVLAQVRAGCDLSKWIAPGLDRLGVMLPYSPLHHLLFDECPDLLVLTSGNRQAEPITIDNDDALNNLAADACLFHDRDIQVACDDSVVLGAAGGPVFFRRARGYVPESFAATALPERSAVALGAELKVTVATLHAGQLMVGRHLGDLDNPRAEQAFAQEVDRMLAFGQIEPEVVVLDQHPDSAAGRFAETRFAGVPLFRVQHHHAHLAAVMAEHGLGVDARVAGIILDGFGHGSDGAIWGGELLLGGYPGFERIGHLRYVPQPGGDRAAAEPGRMATSYLVDAGVADARTVGYDRRIAEICGVRSVSPLTSSAGRLFDGVAAMLGLAPAAQDYEGEAAGRLEAAADPAHQDAYPLPVDGAALDTRVLIRAVLDDAADRSVRAARFINGLADGFSQLALETGSDRVVLGGGCMVNRLLVRRLAAKLVAGGSRVLTARRLPPGDGGISAGQVACAACAQTGGN